MNSAGSELFESYEQDLNTIKESIKQKLNTQIPSLNGEPRKAIIRALEREIEEADEIVGQMDMEILNLPQSVRTRPQSRLRGYKSELDKMKRDSKKVQMTTQSSDRTELLGSRSDSSLSLDASVQDQRTRLLIGTKRLEDSSRRLEESHRVVHEIDSVAINIVSTLQGQTEQIRGFKNRLGEADSHIDRASRTLKEMTRRMTANRFITAAIIAILVILIIIVIYSKLFA